MKSRVAFLSRWLAAVVLTAGCALRQLPPELGTTHPANPQAATSPVPPLETGLLGITNLNGGKPRRKMPEPTHDHDQP